MKNEIKRQQILKALQAECARLATLANKLEQNLEGNTRKRKAA